MKNLIQTVAFIAGLTTAYVAVRQILNRDQPPTRMRFGSVDQNGRYHLDQTWKVI